MSEHEHMNHAANATLAAPAHTMNASAHGAHDHAAMMSNPAMAKKMEADMHRRFWVALVLTIPIAVLAGHVPVLPTLVQPAVSSWISLALSTPVVFW